MVKMYKNYCLYVPDKFQSDELYDEPSAKVWAKVKTEKMDRAVFRAKSIMSTVVITRSA